LVSYHIITQHHNPEDFLHPHYHENLNYHKFNQVFLFQADTKLIIGQVAMDSEKKGMFEDAIKLYDLAGVSTFSIRILMV
jgi:hypothetical protein